MQFRDDNDWKGRQETQTRVSLCIENEKLQMYQFVSTWSTNTDSKEPSNDKTLLMNLMQKKHLFAKWQTHWIQLDNNALVVLGEADTHVFSLDMLNLLLN